jgi:hypothetical protein
LDTGNFGAPQGIASGGPTQTAASIANLKNPPFKACQTNEENVNTLRINNTGTTQNPIPVRVPSSATYVMAGNVRLDRVKSAMDDFDNTKTVSIILKSDLLSNDKLMLGPASPKYTGDILVTSKDGAKQKDIPFNVDTVQTECKFVTLAEAFGAPPADNVAPLGSLGTLQRGSITLPPISKELIGGVLVGVGTDQPGFPKVLNPPFATCTHSNPPTSDDDNLALYIMRGDVSDTSKVFGKNLAVLLTSDLVQFDTDLAKIVKTRTNNANNPFLIANLIADEGTNNAHKIDFTLHDVNTDCKQVSLTTESIFKPVTGSILP